MQNTLKVDQLIISICMAKKFPSNQTAASLKDNNQLSNITYESVADKAVVNNKIKSGPFEIHHEDENLSHGQANNNQTQIQALERNYDCSHYDICLKLAAALNWDNFTCAECSGEISQSLLWRARQAMRKDSVANRICEQLPTIGVISTSEICCNISTKKTQD